MSFLWFSYINLFVKALYRFSVLRQKFTVSLQAAGSEETRGELEARTLWIFSDITWLHHLLASDLCVLQHWHVSEYGSTSKNTSRWKIFVDVLFFLFHRQHHSSTALVLFSGTFHGKREWSIVCERLTKPEQKKKWADWMNACVGSSLVRNHLDNASRLTKSSRNVCFNLQNEPYQMTSRKRSAKREGEISTFWEVLKGEGRSLHRLKLKKGKSRPSVFRNTISICHEFIVPQSSTI